MFPLLKNSKSGVDDRGHRLRITHTRRRCKADVVKLMDWNASHLASQAEPREICTYSVFAGFLIF